MKNSLVALLVFFFLISTRLAHGFGAAGHEVIAAEAWRELEPETKALVIAILKSHPEYARWQSYYHTNASYDIFAYVFMRCSIWPDEINGGNSPYAHPNWHFIDYPLRPPNFAFEPDQRPEDNILYGIAQCEKALSDPKAAPELRAAYLSFLVHMIGDMHQPLHCESYFSDSYPNGDRGGNEFYVKPGDWPVRLHGLWDGTLGSAASPRTQWNYAIELDSRFPRASLPELGKNMTPKDWSLEGRALALDKAYLHGELKGSTTADAAPRLPGDYTKNAKQVAERQAALAGYRLADELEKYLKFDGPVSPLPETRLVDLPTTAPKVISVAEAKNYYDMDMIVTGKVMQVNVRSTVASLYLNGLNPGAPMSAVVFPANYDALGDLQRFNNKDVEITGAVEEYRGRPEIILEKAEQIKISNDH